MRMMIIEMMKMLMKPTKTTRTMKTMTTSSSFSPSSSSCRNHYYLSVIYHYHLHHSHPSPPHHYHISSHIQFTICPMLDDVDPSYFYLIVLLLCCQVPHFLIFFSNGTSWALCLHMHFNIVSLIPKTWMWRSWHTRASILSTIFRWEIPWCVTQLWQTSFVTHELSDTLALLVINNHCGVLQSQLSRLLRVDVGLSWDFQVTRTQTVTWVWANLHTEFGLLLSPQIYNYQAKCGSYYNVKSGGAHYEKFT